jgi:hypothetical protein
MYPKEIGFVLIQINNPVEHIQNNPLALCPETTVRVNIRF